MKKHSIICIIIALIIIIGAIVYKIKGFNMELLYSNRDQILVSSGKKIELNKVEEITKDVLGNRKINVQEFERFGNAVEIVATSISEEEKENIINKINEEYGSEISKDDVKIINISNTRIKDIIKPYIIPVIITLITSIVYFVIIYNKIGVRKILINGIFIPILTVATFYGIISITRIPFGRITNGIAIGLYIASIYVLSIKFQNEKQLYLNKKENDE